MGALGTEQYTFAEVIGLRLTGQPGLSRRLVVSLALDVLPEHWAEDDPERLLHATRLVDLRGDLRLRTGSGAALVAGLSAVSPLPLSPGREPRREELQLAADLSPELHKALVARAGATPRFRLALRGLIEVWANPLYDHDGDQTARVGDHGLSVVLQRMGLRSLAPLHDGDQDLVLSEAEWRRVLTELG